MLRWDLLFGECLALSTPGLAKRVDGKDTGADVGILNILRKRSVGRRAPGWNGALVLLVVSAVAFTSAVALERGAAQDDALIATVVDDVTGAGIDRAHVLLVDPRDAPPNRSQACRATASAASRCRSPAARTW